MHPVPTAQWMGCSVNQRVSLPTTEDRQQEEVC